MWKKCHQKLCKYLVLQITYLRAFLFVWMISFAFKGRFYSIADLSTGILKKGREVLLTGCYLRVSGGSSGCARLLPTEYFVVLLDEVGFGSSFSLVLVSNSVQLYLTYWYCSVHLSEIMKTNLFLIVDHGGSLFWLNTISLVMNIDLHAFCYIY